MREITHYICEYCNTEYNSLDKCQQCEDNHKVDLTIESKKYMPYSKDASGLPNVIEIGYEVDGEPRRAVYRRGT